MIIERSVSKWNGLPSDPTKAGWHLIAGPVWQGDPDPRPRPFYYDPLCETPWVFDNGSGRVGYRSKEMAWGYLYIAEMQVVTP